MNIGSGLKMQISEQMLENDSDNIKVSLLDTSLLDCQGQTDCFIEKYEIKPNGSFSIDAAPLGSVIAYIPNVEWDEEKKIRNIQWQCVGHPRRFMRQQCRVDKSLTLKEKSCQVCH